MIIAKPKNFDLDQIYASGQCFRWEKDAMCGYMITIADKAIRIDDNSVKANGTVEEIVDGDGKVKVTNNAAGAIYSGSGSQNASGLNEGSWEGFSITEADEEGKFYITTFSGAYFKVNAETSEIETTTEQTEAAIFTFKEIGETVKKHITHIFEKLGIENRKEIKQIDKHFES